ncbi:MAG TPA: L,D-transpeptidase [Ktedonobacterales bacterium]
MTSAGMVHLRRAIYAVMSLGLLIVVVAGTACGADPSKALAQHNRAHLDAELQHAQQMGIPKAMLQPVVSAERKTAAGEGGWGYSYQTAAASYASQYAQLMQVEQQSTPVLMQTATQYLGVFSTLVYARQQDGFIEAAGYQIRLSSAQSQLTAAKTPEAIAQVSSYALSQTKALQALVPTYDQLQAFKTSVDAMRKAGITADWASSAYAQDLAGFRAASTPDNYLQLQHLIQGQMTQLVSDSTQAAPYISSSLLAAMQGDIGRLKTYGEDATTFQRSHDAEVKELLSARSPADYLTLLNHVTTVRDQMAIPLARGQARYDVQALVTLVHQTSAKNWLEDYEYADSATGIGDVQMWLQQAPLQYYDNPTCGWDVACRYGQVDAQAVQMATNLRAMLQNLGDKTAASQPHQTDMQLMQGYGFTSGQVTVVSLREQVLRAYQDGKLVYWTYITTGRTGLPTPPGVMYTMSKQTHIIFQPLGPVGPANGYPTPINYAVNFTSPFWHQFIGYYLHDAWWRLQFGPGSNLPHYDPAAWNNGSHGCINFPLSKMGQYYNWVQVGTPVIIY